MMGTRLVPTLVTLLLFIGVVPAQRSSHARKEREHGRGGWDTRDQETVGPYSLGRGGGGGHHGREEHEGRRQNGGHSREDRREEESLPGRSSRTHCSTGSYMNRTSRTCEVCSMCPVNEIIRKPCGVHRDTVCGPFYEFKPGQSSNSPSYRQLQQQQQQQQQEDEPRPARRQHANRAERPDDDHDEQRRAGDAAQLSSGGTGRRHGGTHQGEAPIDTTQAQEIANEQSKGPTLQRSAEQWRELCYGLIGALAAVSLLALLYIILTQVHARRHAHKYSDPQCRTVLSPTMRVFANGLLSNTDYQKITTYNDETTSKRPRHWLLRHLRLGFHKDQSQSRNYVPERDVVIPLNSIPEAVEMEWLQGAPLAVVHQANAAQGQGQGHAQGQGQRLGSTQSWDSGISTHDGPKS